MTTTLPARTLLREVGANIAMSIPPVRAWRVRRGRTSASDVSAQAAHVWAQFSFFLENLGARRLAGATVVEIGPGDSVPLGLLFLGAGAARYVAIDRFMGDTDGAAARDLYAALAAHVPEAMARTWRDMGIAPETWTPGEDSAHVQLVRAPIEEAVQALGERADVVVSFNVVEHLSAVDVAFRHMAAMLGPSGVMLHRVDYGPHHYWRQTPNPMTFLTVPQRLWRMLGDARGYPNRQRHAHVLQAARAAGLLVADRSTRSFAAADVAAVRGHLPPETEALGDRELTVWEGEVLAGKGSAPAFLGEPFRE